MELLSLEGSQRNASDRIRLLGVHLAPKAHVTETNPNPHVSLDAFAFV